MRDQYPSIVAIIVPRGGVDVLRRALRGNGLDPGRGAVLPCHRGPDYRLIKTNIQRHSKEDNASDQLKGLQDCLVGVDGAELTELPLSPTQATLSLRTPNISKSIERWLDRNPDQAYEQAGTTKASLLNSVPTRYTRYGPLLLFPAGTLETEHWKAMYHQVSGLMNTFFLNICQLLRVTHIACTAPIPLQSSGQQNIIRAPHHLICLHGDFGPEPSITTIARPQQQDFDAAFWVSISQYGTHQVWAPRYTMFSRGNIREKARILQMPAVQKLRCNGPSTLVDLYAGIGYFVFPYLRAGMSQALCWDINPWSIEGLARGATQNNQTLHRVEAGKPMDVQAAAEYDIVAFEESNENCLSRIEQMRHAIAPIRHVNCGLLPSSRKSWALAVAALDQEQGGWVHLHENMVATEIEIQSQSIAGEIRQIVDSIAANDIRCTSPPSSIDRHKQLFHVSLDHVEKVKTFAPGVVHCVLDVALVPVVS